MVQAGNQHPWRGRVSSFLAGRASSGHAAQLRRRAAACATASGNPSASSQHIKHGRSRVLVLMPWWQMQPHCSASRRNWLREPLQVDMKPGVWIAADTTAKASRALAGHGATARVSHASGRTEHAASSAYDCNLCAADVVQMMQHQCGARESSVQLCSQPAASIADLLRHGRQHQRPAAAVVCRGAPPVRAGHLADCCRRGPHRVGVLSGKHIGINVVVLPHMTVWSCMVKVGCKGHAETSSSRLLGPLQVGYGTSGGGGVRMLCVAVELHVYARHSTSTSTDVTSFSIHCAGRLPAGGAGGQGAAGEQAPHLGAGRQPPRARPPARQGRQ
jgi:hypothetical protein